jgi:hypothetical protein
MKTRLLPMAVLALLIALAACGVQPEDSPRQVPEELARLGGNPSGGVAVGAERIYLVEPGTEQLLRSVPRDASSAEDLISTLFAGPNDEERNAQFGSAIPSGLSIRSVRSQGSVLYVDVSEQLSTLSGQGLIQALAQIVYTACELDQVDSVQLLVNGARTAWPRADRESTTAALRVYDYPGMVRSAQPAYPSIPAG